MKKNVFISIVLFVLFFLNAQDPVRLVTVDFPPYSFIESGEIKGIQVDIIKKVFDKQGIKYTIELLPFARALFLLENGEKDLLFNFYKNSERLAKFDYSDPILENQLVIFTKKTKNITFSGKIEDLKNYKIGTMIGYTYSEEFDKAKKDNILRVEETSGHIENFKKLIADRIDLYIVEKNVGLYTVKYLDTKKELKILNVPLKTQLGFMGVSKNNPKKSLLSKINTGLKNLKESGEYQKIFDKYIK